MSDSSALVLASRWSNAANRRREGLRAAHTQDAATLIDLMYTYMRLKSAKGARISSITLEHYGESVRRFLAFAGPPESPSRALNQLNAEDFEYWLLTMQSEGLSCSSVQRHLYGLRNLMRALVWAGVLDTDPSQGVRPPTSATPSHTTKRAIPVATYKQLMQLPYAIYPESNARIYRDKVLLALGGSAGLRAAEIMNLTLKDVDLSMKQLLVNGKGGKRRIVPLSSGLILDIKAWQTSRAAMALEGNIKTDALIVSLSHKNYGGKLSTRGGRDIAAVYYKQLGLPAEMWGLHTLRRTAGTHLYKATKDLHAVADLLGHSSVNTSAIYAKMDSDIRREAIEAMEAMRDKL